VSHYEKSLVDESTNNISSRLPTVYKSHSFQPFRGIGLRRLTLLSLASLPISSPSHLNTLAANINTGGGAIQDFFSILTVFS